MRNILTAALLSAAFVAPAHAVSISNVTTTGGSTVDIVTSTPGLIELDAVLTGSGGRVTLDLLGSPDLTGFDFNAFSEFASAPFGVNQLVLELGGGASFETVGTASGAFSIAGLSVDGNRAVVTFTGREFVSATLGDVFGGTDFRIAIAPGMEGTLSLFAVPAPAAIALFGLGALGLATLRRR